MNKLIRRILTGRSHEMDLLLPAPRYIRGDGFVLVDISGEVRKGCIEYFVWDTYTSGFIGGYEPFLASNQFWHEFKTQEDYLLYE